MIKPYQYSMAPVVSLVVRLGVRNMQISDESTFSFRVSWDLQDPNVRQYRISYVTAQGDRAEEVVSVVPFEPLSVQSVLSLSLSLFSSVHPFIPLSLLHFEFEFQFSVLCSVSLVLYLFNNGRHVTEIIPEDRKKINFVFICF